MSAEVINLCRARKTKVRVEADLRAATNRALHGRTRSARELEDARQDKDNREHKGKKLDR